MLASEEQAEDPRERIERIGWQTGPSRRAAAAAVSASQSVLRDAPTEIQPGVARPASGPYEGETDEPFARGVSFRFLGGGIRDLVVGDRMVAQWIPVRGADVQVMSHGAEIRLSWVAPREVHGAVVRRRRGRPEITRFVAVHRFRGFAHG